jgi:hypothetical protein
MDIGHVHPHEANYHYISPAQMILIRWDTNIQDLSTNLKTVVEIPYNDKKVDDMGSAPAQIVGRSKMKSSSPHFADDVTGQIWFVMSLDWTLQSRPALTLLTVAATYRAECGDCGCEESGIEA